MSVYPYLLGLVGCVLVACTPSKTLPQLSDTSFYQDVMLDFPLDEGSEALQRIRQHTQHQATIKVGLNMQTPPFVMQDTDGSLHGFTIDSVKRMAQMTHQKIEWVPYHHLSDLLAALTAGKIDVAAGGITDTKARRQQGMVFVPELRQDELAMLTGFAKDTHISKELMFLIGLFVLSLLFYMRINVRKLRHSSLSRTERWATAFHETVAVHFSRDAKLPLETPKDKILDAIQLMKGPAFLSLIITFAVVDYLNAGYEVRSLADIQNKVVVTKAGTNTVHLLQQPPQQVDELRDAVAMFLQGNADVVVHDASMLKHYEHMLPQNARVIKTGKNRSHTGFAFRDANLALAYQEAATYMLQHGEYEMLLYGYNLKD